MHTDAYTLGPFCRAIPTKWHIPARVALLLAASSLAACGAPRKNVSGTSSKATATPIASAAETLPHSKRPVVVAVVVDQFPAWLAEERLSLLPSTGGFARLMREGLSVRSIRYEHAVTDTAPGHSALFTGVTPRFSGIVANELCDAKGTRISFLRDDKVDLVGPEGKMPRKGSSLANLRVETVADRLRATHPEATIVSLALKDRGSLFGGGRTPTASLWLDTERVSWVTSTAVKKDEVWFRWAQAPELPEWTVLAPAWLSTHVRVVDDVPGEGNFFGLGTTFPHRVPQGADRGRAMRATPMADAWMVATAERAFDNYLRNETKGGDSAPFFLSLSFSAHDYIAHAFGPDSWEAWDELLRLDGQLETLMTVLDRHVGPNGWSMVLSGDHGGLSIPETPARPNCERDPWNRPCKSGPRVDPTELQKRINRAVEKSLGAGPWILNVADPYVWFTPKANADLVLRQRVMNELRGFVAKEERWVEHAIDTAITMPRCASGLYADDRAMTLVCESLAPNLPSMIPVTGDVLLVARPGAFFENDYTPGKGGNHGTPWLYDRSVPLLVRAPGKVTAAETIAEPMSFRAYARALTDLLGVPPLEPTRNQPSMLVALSPTQPQLQPSYPVGAIGPTPQEMKDACPFLFETTQARQVNGIAITAVATNNSDKPQTLSVPTECPGGSIKFLGLPGNYDFYGTCLAGACMPVPGGRPPTTWTIAPHAKAKLTTVLLEPKGNACNAPLAPGSYDVFFAAPTSNPKCLAAVPTKVVLASSTPARPAPPRPEKPSVVVPSKPPPTMH